MSYSRMSPFLRWVLLADAATCAASGLLMVFGAGLLDELFGLPAALTVPSGIFLLPFAGLLVYVATRERVYRPVVWAIVGGNVLWAIDSVLMLAAGWLEPTAAGSAFVVAQALGVLAFAGLEYLGLRRSAVAA